MCGLVPTEKYQNGMKRKEKERVLCGRMEVGGSEACEIPTIGFWRDFEVDVDLDLPKLI